MNKQIKIKRFSPIYLMIILLGSSQLFCSFGYGMILDRLNAIKNGQKKFMDDSIPKEDQLNALEKEVDEAKGVWLDLSVKLKQLNLLMQTVSAAAALDSDDQQQAASSIGEIKGRMRSYCCILVIMENLNKRLGCLMDIRHFIRRKYPFSRHFTNMENSLLMVALSSIWERIAAALEECNACGDNNYEHIEDAICALLSQFGESSSYLFEEKLECEEQMMSHAENSWEATKAEDEAKIQELFTYLDNQIVMQPIFVDVVPEGVCRDPHGRPRDGFGNPGPGNREDVNGAAAMGGGGLAVRAANRDNFLRRLWKYVCKHQGKVARGSILTVAAGVGYALYKKHYETDSHAKKRR